MRRFCFFAVALISVPYSAGASDIRIEEIFFNPIGADTGFEYIVLENGGAEGIDVTGWSLYPDGVGYFTLPALTLASSARITIYLRITGTATDNVLYHAAATGNMGNTSGSVALFSSTEHSKDTMIDFMQYGRSGETWESGAADIGLWTKGDAVATEPDVEGKVLQRTGNGTGISAWALVDATSHTPTTEQQTIASTPVADESDNTYSGPTEVSTIRAIAGGDRRGITGGEIVFHANALGWHDELLTSGHIRYVWNFGNGVLYEGKAARHIYSYPGVYIATLYIASGEQTARDDVKITIVENPLSISRVVVGTNGFVELANPSGEKIDISGWRLVEGGRAFVFPPHTLIAPKAHISIGNDVLRFAFDSSLPIIFAYPNGKIAMEYRQDKKIAIASSTDTTRASDRVPAKVLIATSSISEEVALPLEPLAASIGGEALSAGRSRMFWLFGSIAVGIAFGLGIVAIQRGVSRI